MRVSILPGIPAPVRSSEFVVLRSAQGAAKPSASPQPTSSGSSQSPPSAGTAAVTIGNFKFVPACLTVSQDTITLTNRDTTAHTTTADDGKSFDTGNIDPGSSATISLSKQGTYKYHCNIHPFMHGTLVVKFRLPHHAAVSPRRGRRPQRTTSRRPAARDRRPRRSCIREKQWRRAEYSYPCE